MRVVASLARTRNLQFPRRVYFFFLLIFSLLEHAGGQCNNKNANAHLGNETNEVFQGNSINRTLTLLKTSGPSGVSSTVDPEYPPPSPNLNNPSDSDEIRLKISDFKFSKFSSKTT